MGMSRSFKPTHKKNSFTHLSVVTASSVLRFKYVTARKQSVRAREVQRT